jgi:hypothetical protein
MFMTKKEKLGLDLIYGHAGKRRVYETYLKSNPEMAQKYLSFIAKNTDAQYIKWDGVNNRFKA